MFSSGAFWGYVYVVVITTGESMSCHSGTRADDVRLAVTNTGYPPVYVASASNVHFGGKCETTNLLRLSLLCCAGPLLCAVQWNGWRTQVSVDGKHLNKEKSARDI